MMAQNLAGVTAAEGTAPAAAGDSSVTPSPAAPAAPPRPEMGEVLSVLESFAPGGWTCGQAQVSAFFSNTVDGSLSPQTASILREFKCTGMASKFFQRGQRLVVARLYRFMSADGAYGAYTTLRQGSSSGLRRGDASSEDDQSISIWQGDYFINVYTTAEDDDEAKGLVVAATEKLLSGLHEHASVPALLSLLPQVDRVGGSERFLMGPVAARRVAPLPYVGSLSLEKSRAAVAADYQFREPQKERLKLVLIDYGDPAVARDVYRKYADDLSEEHEITESATSSLFKTSGGWLFCQVHGSQLAVIGGARKKQSPQLLGRQLVR